VAREAAEQSIAAADEAAIISTRTSQQAVKKAEEASKAAREAAELSILGVTEATSTLRQISQEAVRKAEDVSQAVRETAELSMKASQEAAMRAEEETEVARKAAESSTNASLKAVSRADEISKSAMATATVWNNTSQEMIKNAEEASQVAKEAAELSIKVSQEAVVRAEEARKAASDVAEALIKAIEEAIEASKDAARGAAEPSVRVFNQLISSIVEISEKNRSYVKQIPIVPISVSGECNANINRTSETSEDLQDVKRNVSPENNIETEGNSKSSDRKKEILPQTSGSVISKVRTDTYGVEETNEVKKRIERRLESLAQMYLSSKDIASSEEDDTEDN
jgi:hypothetical protein